MRVISAFHEMSYGVLGGLAGVQEQSQFAAGGDIPVFHYPLFQHSSLMLTVRNEPNLRGDRTEANYRADKELW
jgi:hypothetical protein